MCTLQDELASFKKEIFDFLSTYEGDIKSLTRKELEKPFLEKYGKQVKQHRDVIKAHQIKTRPKKKKKNVDRFCISQGLMQTQVQQQSANKKCDDKRVTQQEKDGNVPCSTLIKYNTLLLPKQRQQEEKNHNVQRACADINRMQPKPLENVPKRRKSDNKENYHLNENSQTAIHNADKTHNGATLDHKSSLLQDEAKEQLIRRVSAVPKQSLNPIIIIIIIIINNIKI
ncbi:hypothetical protein RFI_22432 [Reticulomyxa filosa]|uniref:Uncharacterized protein n=1 Tax=Reticulomyxa filosa TaxID=46433 RepID=X6MMS1_RETFI|nr:hypothetical protein RFI_22432 [Reticulomyxa filosa]|eukprot:ETO14936.1 hypothetical protein RFI_22432 [Reticulomyxa filosa]